MLPNGSAAAENLLREVAHVQRLARAIVRDAQQAHDVAQDTLLVALQRPPRAADDPRTLRAWLTKVVRSLARRTFRDAQHRARREQAAATEPEDREDRTAASLQQQRELLAAVAELAEPYRTAITMRFLEGSSPRAIASALDVEPAAVRQRIHRGLAMLRARLERTHGDARLAVAAIVPWSAWSTVLLQGVSIVATKKLVACGAAVAVAAAFLFPRGDERGPAYPGTLGSADTAAPVVASPSALDPPPARSPLPEATPFVPPGGSATTGELIVELYATADDVLPGAPVTIVPIRDLRVPVGDEREAVTDATGRARFAALPPGTWMIVVDGRTSKWGSTQVTIPAGEVVVRELRLNAGLTLAGLVVDPNGNAVPHARVCVAQTGRASTLAVAGPAGEFRITNLPTSSTVQARAAGMQPSRAVLVGDAAVAGGAEIRVELHLGGRARCIRGRVHDASGRPWAHARVAMVPAAERRRHRWEQPSAIEWLRTDDAGAFLYEECAAGPWIVVAQAVDHAEPPVAADVDVTNADGFVELRAAAGARLRGRVVRGGESVDASVVAWPDDAGAGATALVQDLGWRESARSAEGAFDLVGLVAGPVRVRVITDGSVAHEEVVELGTGEVRERVFDLPPAGDQLDVAVRGAQDKTIMAMLVPAGELAVELGRLVPLVRGEATFRGARSTSLDVYLVFFDNKSDMVQLAVRRDVARATTRVEIELPPAALPARYVTGRFVGERLEPVAQRSVEVRRTDEPQLLVRRRVATGPDGRFRIGPLPPGQYDVFDANEPEPRSVVRRFLGVDRDEDVGDVVIRAPR